MSQIETSPIARTQAERRAETRRALLDAAIEILMNAGLAKCSLGVVAKQAGLTTGAVQHHFKTKTALILAVIEERLFGAERVRPLEELADKPLEEACRILVDQQWGFYGDPKYIAIWDIILGARNDEDIQSVILNWQQRSIAALENAMMAAFRNHAPSKQLVQSVQYFMNAHLRGLALLRTVDPNEAEVKRQLDWLAQSLANKVRIGV